MSARNYFVSLQGDDSAAGTQAAPFRTLSRAAERLSGEKNTITVMPGFYENVSVILDSRASNLTIRGENAVLCGGVRISGWRAGEDGVYRAVLPDSVPSGFRLLTVNGQWRERARYPHAGRLRHLSTFTSNWLSTTAGGWDVKPTPEQLTSLAYDPADIPAGFNWPNAEATVFHKWDDTLAALSGMDTRTHTFRLAVPCTHPPGAYGSDSYILWNTIEGMEPGRWRLDKERRELCYHPLPGENLTAMEIYAPCCDSIFTLEGEIENLTIEGLSFTLTSTPMQPCGFGAGHLPGAVQGAGTLRNCRFASLSFANLSGWGIQLKGDNRRLTVEGCDIHDTGAGGIGLRGRECAIRNNRVSRAGRIYYSAIGINASGCDIIDNELSDLPYTGIACGGKSARITGNRVTNAVNVLNDGAGIYATFCEGGVMSGNLVSDIRQKDELDSTRNGLYLDEQCRGWLVERNLTVNCPSAMMNHMASENTVRHNAFVCLDGPLLLSFIRCAGYTFEENTLQAAGKVTVAQRRDAFAGFAGNLFHSGYGRRERVPVADDYSRGEAEEMEENMG